MGSVQKLRAGARLAFRIPGKEVAEAQRAGQGRASMEDRVAAATNCHHGQAPELSSLSEFPPSSSPALSLSLCVRDSIFRLFSSHPYIHRYTVQLIHSCLYCFVCLTTITMCPIPVCPERYGMGHIDSALCKPELCLGLTSGCPGAVE